MMEIVINKTCFVILMLLVTTCCKEQHSTLENHTTTIKVPERNNSKKEVVEGKNELVENKHKYLPRSEFYKTELWNSNMNTYITLNELYKASKNEINSLVAKISEKVPDKIISHHFSDAGGNFITINLTDSNAIALEEDGRVSLYIMNKSLHYLKYQNCKLDLNMDYDEVLNCELLKENYTSAGEDYIVIPLDPGDQDIVMKFDTLTKKMINLRLWSRT